MEIDPKDASSCRGLGRKDKSGLTWWRFDSLRRWFEELRLAFLSCSISQWSLDDLVGRFQALGQFGSITDRTFQRSMATSCHLLWFLILLFWPSRRGRTVPWLSLTPPGSPGRSRTGSIPAMSSRSLGSRPLGRYPRLSCPNHHDMVSSHCHAAIGSVACPAATSRPPHVGWQHSLWREKQTKNWDKKPPPPSGQEQEPTREVVLEHTPASSSVKKSGSTPFSQGRGEVSPGEGPFLVLVPEPERSWRASFLIFLVDCWSKKSSSSSGSRYTVSSSIWAFSRLLDLLSLCLSLAHLTQSMALQSSSCEDMQNSQVLSREQTPKQALILQFWQWVWLSPSASLNRPYEPPCWSSWWTASWKNPHHHRAQETLYPRPSGPSPDFWTCSPCVSHWHTSPNPWPLYPLPAKICKTHKYCHKNKHPNKPWF